MISVHGLSLKFDKNKSSFFKDVSATFNAGALHFIVGKNGSGKSTLFRLLRGIVAADEVVTGTVCVDDTCKQLDCCVGAARGIERVGLVAQDYDSMLADDFSFINNLQLACLSYIPTLKPLPAIPTLPMFLDRFNLDLHKPVRSLSGGQRQVLAMLMAVQQGVRVLLLDEPTAALDDHNAAVVMSFIQDLVVTMSMTALIICHDKTLVQRHAPRGYHELIVCDDGTRRLVKISS